MLGPCAGSHLFADIEDMAPLVLPTWENFPGNGAPGVKVWSGWIEVYGNPKWKMELSSLQVRLV